MNVMFQRKITPSYPDPEALNANPDATRTNRWREFILVQDFNYWFGLFGTLFAFIGTISYMFINKVEVWSVLALMSTFLLFLNAIYAKQHEQKDKLDRIMENNEQKNKLDRIMENIKSSEKNLNVTNNKIASIEQTTLRMINVLVENKTLSEEEIPSIVERYPMGDYFYSNLNSSDF